MSETGSMPSRGRHGRHSMPPVPMPPLPPRPTTPAGGDDPVEDTNRMPAIRVPLPDRPTPATPPTTQPSVPMPTPVPPVTPAGRDDDRAGRTVDEPVAAMDDTDPRDDRDDRFDKDDDLDDDDLDDEDTDSDSDSGDDDGDDDESGEDDESENDDDGDGSSDGEDDGPDPLAGDNRLGVKGRMSVACLGFVPVKTVWNPQEAFWYDRIRPILAREAAKARDKGLSEEKVRARLERKRRELSPAPPHRTGKPDLRGIDDARGVGRLLANRQLDAQRRVRRARLDDQEGMLPLSAAGPLDRLMRDCNERPLVPWHQTSAGRAGVLTTMVAGSGAPPIPGPVLGVDLLSGEPYTYDSWGTFDAGMTRSPDMFLSGQRGNGKSFFCKTLAVREIEWGRHVIVQSDRQGEWARIAGNIGGQIISPGAGVYMNPFELPATDPAWRDAHLDEWVKEIQVGRRSAFRTIAEALPDRDGLYPLDRDQESIIDALVTDFGTGEMTLTDAVDRLASREWIDRVGPHIKGFENYPEQAAEAAARTARVFNPLIGEGAYAGMFDRESTISPDPSSPMIVFDTSSPLFEDEQLKHIYTACVSAWIDRLLQRRDGLRRIVVIEEAWDVVKDAGLVDSLQTRQRSAGHWGCATWLIVHGASDMSEVFDQGSALRGRVEMLMKLMETKVTFQQNDLAVLERIIPDMSEDEIATIPRLEKGVAIVRVGHEHPRMVTALAGASMGALFDTSALRRGA